MANDNEYIGDNTSELVRQLTLAASDPHSVGSFNYVLVPDNTTLKDITDLVAKEESHPRKKKGALKLQDINSFITYCNQQECENTGYIYADIESRKICAVFDDHRGKVPGWREHRCSLDLNLGVSWQGWVLNDRVKHAQSEFAEFIEDHITDIIDDNAANLLDIATTMSASTVINCSSAKRLHDGQTQIMYNEVIDAKAGASGTLTIPRKFRVSVEPFKNCGAIFITVRLKYRIGQGGSITFIYEIENREDVISNKFLDIVDRISKNTNYQVLVGAA